MNKAIYFIIFFAACTIACSSGSNKVKGVKLGMTATEVEGLIGAPSEKVQVTKGDEFIEIWHYKEQEEIVSAVQFTGNEVSEIISDFQESQSQAAKLMEHSRQKE